MSNYNLSFTRDIKRFAHLTPDIEILASDGKIGAFRHELTIASPILQKMFMANPNLTIIDLKEYDQDVVQRLLNLIYAGNFSMEDENLKDSIFRLATELQITIEVLPQDTKKIKVAAPKAPEELLKNDDPGLIDLGGGKVKCGLCMKVFGEKGNGTKHYQNIHMTDKSQKNIICQAPGCNKLFRIKSYMQAHMNSKHGIKVSELKSASKVKQPKKQKTAKHEEKIEMKQEPIEQ